MGQAVGPSSEGRIASWDDLHGRERAIVEALNGDRRLALAAAANPVLAIEALGYEIAPEARQAIEDRFRFPPRVARQLAGLRRDVFKAAGRELDPTDDGDVRAVLSELGLHPGRRRFEYEPAWQARMRERRRVPAAGRPKKAAKAAKAARSAQAAQAAPAAEVRPAEDPLEAFRGRHPAIEPLIELRRIEGSAPPLARPEAFAAIRDGDVKLPVTRVRGVLREG